MSQSRTSKSRRNIPEHVKRAVKARDGERCRRCGVVTEFLHWDHLVPYDLGGPTTEENIQRLCPTCNTSKGNKIQCRRCAHWMSPDKSRCSQCETPLLYTKYSKTFRGRLDRFFQKAGIAAVIGAVVMVLLVIMVGASLIGFYVLRPKATADQAATVNTIVNTSFTVSPDEPVSFRIVIPKGAKNSRAVGVFKVTSGTAVNVYIVSEEQFAQWATGTARPAIALREESHSAKLRQPLVSGSYYLLFASPNADAVTVAAEFYSKYD